ncbi:GntR family transcriptional regulator [Leucobacter sp. GX24907]
MSVAEAFTGGVIEPLLVADQVYDFIEGEILSGRLPGGSRLRVRQLAEMAGTSVMPVRDAISRLEESGLAEREAHKGAVVKKFSTPELIDIYSVRQMLEPAAARQGVENLSKRGLGEMERRMVALERAVEEDRPGDALEHDSEFLRAMYRDSGNELLCDMIDALWKRSHLYRITVTTDDVREGGTRTTSCDRRILEAARGRDGEAAAEWMAIALGKAIRVLTTLDRD